MYDELQTLLLSFIFMHLHTVWEKPVIEKLAYLCIIVFLKLNQEVHFQNIYGQLNETNLGLACEWAFEGMRCGEFCFKHEKEIHK